MRVLVFGDSIAWGGYDTEGGWVDRIKRDFLKSGHRARILNHGIGGDTSEYMKKRVDPTILSARISTKEIAVVLTVGVNDSRLVVDGSKPEVEIRRYKSNIKEMFETIKSYTNRILIVGQTTIHPEVDEVFAKEYVYKRARIAEYNKILFQEAEAAGLRFVDIAEVVRDEKDYFYKDKLHLSDEGHQKISEILAPHIEELTR